MEHSIFCAGRADCSRSSSAFLPMADMPETRWRSLCGALGMEVGNREAIPCCRIRSLAQAMDRRKDIRLDQSQSPLGARLRTLCHDRHCLHPPRHDQHHVKATCCKRFVMTPIFSDGFLEVATHQPRTKKMKAFGDEALSNFHFPKVPPPGGRPRWGTLSADAAQARLGVGGSVSPAPLSSSFT